MTRTIKVRTRDGVELSFGDRATVLAWLRGGKLSLEDRFLGPSGEDIPLSALVALLDTVNEEADPAAAASDGGLSEPALQPRPGPDVSVSLPVPVQGLSPYRETAAWSEPSRPPAGATLAPVAPPPVASPVEPPVEPPQPVAQSSGLQASDGSSPQAAESAAMSQSRSTATWGDPLVTEPAPPRNVDRLSHSRLTAPLSDSGGSAVAPEARYFVPDPHFPDGAESWPAPASAPVQAPLSDSRDTAQLAGQDAADRDRVSSPPDRDEPRSSTTLSQSRETTPWSSAADAGGPDGPRALSGRRPVVTRDMFGGDPLEEEAEYRPRRRKGPFVVMIVLLLLAGGAIIAWQQGFVQEWMIDLGFAPVSQVEPDAALAVPPVATPPAPAVAAAASPVPASVPAPPAVPLRGEEPPAVTGKVRAQEPPPAPEKAKAATGARGPEVPRVKGGEPDEPGDASGSFEGHMNLAAQFATSDPDKAMTHLQFAARMRPASPEPQSRMGDIELRRGNTGAAGALFGAALKKSEYGPALIGMARLSARQGNDSSARGYYRRYLETNRTGSQAAEARKYLGED